MPQTIPSSFFVNEEKKQYLLALNEQGAPFITSNNGSTVTLPANAFGAWFLRTHFKDVAATQSARLWYEHNNPEKAIDISHLKNTHRKYQHLALIRMVFSNCGIWLDMGLGKTFISISFALWLFQHYNLNLSLVVCSPTLFGEWEDQINEHILPEQNKHIVVAHGLKRKKLLNELRFNTPPMPVFILTSFDTVGSILHELSALPLGSIFVDEAARIKNLKTARTQALYQLRDKVPTARRFLLSGTPSTKDIKGNYALYEWLNPGSSGAPDFVTFCKRYISSKLFMRCRTPEGVEVHVLAEPDEQKEKWLKKNYPLNGGGKSWFDLGYRFGFGGGDKTIRILHHYPREFGAKNLDEWHRVVQTHSYAVYKEDVLPELPPKVYTRRDVKMTEEMRKAYVSMVEENKVELEGKTLNFNATTGAHVKLHQIANGFLKADDGTVHYFKDNPKLDLLEELIEEIGENKMVIWSPYHPQMKQLRDHLAKLKLPFAFLHGELSAAQRKEQRAHFIDPKGAQFCVANPGAAGEGLNLQCAHIEWFVANWWKPDTRAQAEDRCHRIGQLDSVSIIDSPTTGTLEVSILHALKKKHDLERRILKPSDLLGEIK